MKEKKLHLGCGQYYLEDYINIDYPNTNQSVQQEVVADEHADLLELRYEPSSIEEIRLHHVFEHFMRSTTCALLSTWNSWLIPGGILRIEVPDFEECVKAAFGLQLRPRQNGAALRHIFGSQEEHWAIHYHGYSKDSLVGMLEMFGFKTVNVNQFQWEDLFNLDVTVEKVKSHSRKEFDAITKKYLSHFMVDEGPSEQDQLKIWMGQYEEQMKKSF